MRDKTYGGLRVRLTGGIDRQGGGEGPLVVLMHGFGAPGDDLVPLARVLDVPREVRFAFPEAPLDLGPEAMNGRAWWWIDMMRVQVAAMRGETIDRSQDVPEGLAEARASVIAMLAEVERALAPSHVTLGGFSQGAMLACDVALHTDVPLAGLAMLSGTLLSEPEWTRLAPKRRGLRAVVSHGQSDPILPFAGAERLRDVLARAGLDVTWVPFRGVHEIPPLALDALAKLIRDGSPEAPAR
jgi:phospholipase/carboxylesterase